MITKVFEKFTFVEIQKIKKTIHEKEQKIYYEPTTRTERVYEPPTGVTHCLHCGVKLRDSMWIYSKSGKYLCPDCWYRRTTSVQRDRYRQQAQKMSTGGYSYKTITENVKKTRVIDKTKEIEVEEPITKNGIKLVWPIDIDYKANNKIISSTFSIFDNGNVSKALQKSDYFKDDVINQDPSWYQTTSYKNAVSKLKEIKHDKDYQRVKIFNLGPIPFSEVIVDEKQVLEEFVDVVGFYPNVPAFIQGHPLNMYNNKRKNIVNIDRIITIYCNLTFDSKCDFGHYKNRGIILFSLIEHLMSNDFKVNLKLLEASFIDGETIIQEFEPKLYKKLDVKHPDIFRLKEEQELELNILYNMLTSPSFYRVLMLENKVNIIKNQKLNDKWFDGLGFCLKSSDLRKILNISDDMIVIGNPFEHGINGLFLDDDFLNFMDSIGVSSDIEENIDESRINDKNIQSARDIITIRGITKLIHVTAKENIPSIYELGLISKTTLMNQNKEFHQNDYLRLDNHLDSICLSVSEPNNYLFREFSKRNPGVEYHVIEIDPKILYELKSENKDVRRIYSDYNAASRYSKTSELDMEIMFQDRIRRKAKVHTRQGLQTHQPTSAQAEILFFNAIPLTYVLDIYPVNFQDEESANISRKENSKTITEICREIGSLSPNDLHKKLLELGYLDKTYKNGKPLYVPTLKGENIGVNLETRKSAKEVYQVNVYSENAVKIIRELVQ